MPKIRSGFVSNSSSSSFIVTFDPDKVPVNSEELCEIIFPDVDQNDFVNYYDKTEYTHKDVADRLFEDLMTTKLPNHKELVDEIYNTFRYWSNKEQRHKYHREMISDHNLALIGEYESIDERLPNLYNLLYHQTEELSEEELKNNRDLLHSMERRQSVIDDILKKDYFENLMKSPEFAGKKLFYCEYGDEDGDFFRMMEHGDHWKNLDGLIISHH